MDISLLLQSFNYVTKNYKLILKLSKWIRHELIKSNSDFKLLLQGEYLNLDRIEFGKLFRMALELEIIEQVKKLINYYLLKDYKESIFPLIFSTIVRHNCEALDVLMNLKVLSLDN